VEEVEVEAEVEEGKMRERGGAERRRTWTASFASLAILALPGSVRFMMREMLAIGRKRSCSLQASEGAGQQHERRGGGRARAGGESARHRARA
jgi:hypothetical protein